MTGYVLIFPHLLKEYASVIFCFPFAIPIFSYSIIPISTLMSPLKGTV